MRVPMLAEALEHQGGGSTTRRSCPRLLLAGVVVCFGTACHGSDHAGNAEGTTSGNTAPTSTGGSVIEWENPCAPAATGLVTFSPPSGPSNDPTFQVALRARWRELRQGVLADAEIVDRIRRLTQGLASAAQRNFDKWPILTTELIEQFETPTADTWERQVEVMQEWLLGRAAWLDTQW